MSIKKAIGSGAVLLAVTAGGCGGDDAKPRAKGPWNPPFKTRVNITKDGYSPAHVKVLLGGQITFVNLDTDPHTAETKQTDETATDDNEFDTHTLIWEEPYTVTFHKPGAIDFHSSFDPEMKGTVEVLAKR